MSNSAPPPPWLQDLCMRLLENDAELRNLNLNLRRLNSDKMQVLATALVGNTSLEVLNLVNSITTRFAETQIAQVLSQTKLRRLYLSYNQITDDGAASFGLALSQQGTALIELHLDFNSIGPQGAASLVSGVLQNHELKVLMLDCNSISDVGAYEMGRLLTLNTSLHTLGLGRNSIGVNGGRALLEPLEAGRNLTLKRMNLNGNGIDTETLDKISFYLGANQSGRYLLSQDDDRIPIGLWPLVLGRIKDRPSLIYFFLISKPDLCKKPTMSLDCVKQHREQCCRARGDFSSAELLRC